MVLLQFAGGMIDGDVYALPHDERHDWLTCRLVHEVMAWHGIRMGWDGTDAVIYWERAARRPVIFLVREHSFDCFFSHGSPVDNSHIQYLIPHCSRYYLD